MFTLLALSLPALLPAQEPAAAPPVEAARIAAEKGVIRSFHHPSMPVVAELPAGTPVRITARREPWARVQVPGGLVVWVYGTYVERRGARGVLTTDHVRARPLPSTGPESYPVGQFAKGDEVAILGEKGDWLQVRAPERLGGWIRLADLEVLGAEPSGWADQWAAARRTLLAPVAAEAAAPAPEPDAAALDQAEAKLARLAAGPWDSALADEVEAVLGAVLWSSDDVVRVDRARIGLDRLETLRAAAALAEKVEAEKMKHAREAVAAEAAAARLESGPAQPKAPADRFTLIGWLEYRPRVYSAAPWVIVAGGREQPVLALEGRYRLQEFADREVAVRGRYRPSSRPGLKVLEIERLRVLPQRPR
ncbi:MAG: hypothetical protein D6702_04050 [Planctomycetota bacterium]|nr:MAG: hypothetical protein D6702_04050 [Planctomycetota bacterium]